MSAGRSSEHTATVETVDPRTLRVGLTVVVAVVVALAAVVDPASLRDISWMLLAAVALVGWGWWPYVPTPLLAVVMGGALVLATQNKGLEQSLFLMSVLTLTVAWFEASRWRSVFSLLVALAVPVTVWYVLPPSENFGALSWLLGIGFPWLLGLLVRRQFQLAERLDAARQELAAQVVAEERRRIARDVHDLVGHGLAAVLLQITSARHVLRRDPDGADAALAEAETAGRRSMAELRTTMALLRAADDTGLAAPVPGLDGITLLVDDAVARGLDVTYRTTGDLAAPAQGVALAAHRIVAEALANALRHAPAAATTVCVDVAGDSLTVEVTSRGTLAPAPDDGRTHYGLVGMRERAEIVGGRMRAGAVPEGWQVHAHLPYAVT
jgi:signal transduction histidine kinase